MNLGRHKMVARGFTLVELLVVLSIIAVLAAVGLPAIRGMNKSNAMLASNRQFEDDLSYARQRAIADHTSVYVVFVPPTLINYTPSALTNDAATMAQYTNLLGGQYTSYALISMRLLGEQPGRSTPHYLTEWRNLPNGIFFAEANFSLGPTPGYNPDDPVNNLPPTYLKFTNSFPTSAIFPFPNATNFPGINLPYIGFDYLGRLTYADGTTRLADMNIPLARGSIFYQRTPGGSPIAALPSVQESPASNSVVVPNWVHLNALTGRASIISPSIP